MKKLTPRTIALSLEYHLFKKDKAFLKPLFPAKLQAMVRRRARAKYLVWEAQAYNEWMKLHLEQRRVKYAAELQPGLLSIATPVWDGTPLEYLRLLAQCIADQNASGACEWLVLDNGCTKAKVRSYLDELARQYKWVTLHREARNEGIVGGLRVCLVKASGRYLCPVDSDDLLYPDCLQIVQWWIRRSGYAPLLYSDEDKVIGTQAVQPYFKPDFDPVLLLNSAYIAHLGVIDRAKALELGAYSDRAAEGSPDWDCFVRFYTAGYEAIHIPEVIYSWRMHPESTSDDVASKPYIHTSQRAVIGRYLEAMGLSETHTQVYSPLLPGTVDWWIERRHVEPVKALLLSEENSEAFDYPDLDYVKLPPSASFRELISMISAGTDLVCLLQRGLKPVRDDCIWEAQGIFERFPDAGMVGGWVASRTGQVEDGPLVLGFDGACGCPDAGRAVVDPGYFTQMRKQRSVSAVSSRFAIFQAKFLKEAYESGGFQDIPVGDLGPWLGQFALTRKERIIFSPFLRCEPVGEAVTARTAMLPRVAVADHRFYPRHFGLTSETAYKLDRLRE
jgi:glycosyltransferase involved in cell wall biosynthesis